MKEFPNSFSTSNFKFVDYIMLNEEESRILWNARNDDEIRKWMVNKDIITWDNHLQFMRSLPHKSDRKYYAVFNFDGDLVGSQSINPLDGNERGESGLYLLPSFQGKGLGKLMKKEFIKYLFTKELLQVVTEKVRHENKRNNQLNISLGFILQRRDSEYNYYELRKDNFINL